MKDKQLGVSSVCVRWTLLVKTTFRQTANETERKASCWWSDLDLTKMLFILHFLYVTRETSGSIGGLLRQGCGAHWIEHKIDVCTYTLM
jgi:hypothetical protein